jgi:hypothetical protein
MGHLIKKIEEYKTLEMMFARSPKKLKNELRKLKGAIGSP